MNLCVSARDAMPRGGTLTIRTENTQLQEPHDEEIAAVVADRYVLLTVEDTGCGMDERTRAQIFEPFFTTKGIGEGSGLGLATVYGIVKQHNGFIEVDSDVGQGAKFRIYFPCIDHPVDRDESRADETALGGAETVLLAEDETMVRELVGKMLRAAGYTVVAACDGAEALRRFEENPAMFDLVLLDVMMPRMGGHEVMEAIQATHPHVRFLFSTGYSESALRAHFVAEKGMHVIGKPYRTTALLRAVREALDTPVVPEVH